MAGFKAREQAPIDYGIMPDIDISRLIGTYIRQSKKDADDKNGESRQTQLDLKNYATYLATDKGAGIREYDEGSGMSGQKRIDERPELNRLYHDMENNLISVVIVSREDRLFRDKMGAQSGTFMELAEKRKVILIIPPLFNARMRFYDFSNYEHVKAFKERMKTAYDYVDTHIRYMNANQKSKGMRGNYEGRGIPPGFAVPYGQEKMEQKIDVYKPWACIMEEIYSLWEAYDYSIPLLVRHIEKMPYLFPDIPKEDLKKYCFKTSIDKVPGGFKPKASDTLKSWFKNVAYIGWWLVSTESGEVIIDNHPAIIERERFEKGYIALTGCTLDGIPVNSAYPKKRHQARRGKEWSPDALLRFVLSSPVAPWVGVTTTSNRYKGVIRKELYYRGDKKDKGDIYPTSSFSVKCEELDEIVIQRIRHLSEVDKLLASRIETSLEEVRKQQVKECVSIDDQITQIDKNLLKLASSLVDSILNEEDDKDGEATKAITSKKQELRGQKRELEEKRKHMGIINGKEEVRRFYTVLENFIEEWPKLDINQKQKLIKLLTTKVELVPCSMHWYKLTIHWIGPVCDRPDIAYIWRMKPEIQQALDLWEIELIRDNYSKCSMEYLLEKLPNRTWATIAKNAAIIGVQRQVAAKRRILPDNIAWEDVLFFPDKESAVAMAKEATKSCQQLHLPMCAMWLLELPSIEELENECMTHCINDDTANQVYSAVSSP